MNFKKGFTIGLMALGLSMSAQAEIVNIGGVVWNPDSMFDFTSNQNIIEDQLNFDPAEGPIVTELTGFGEMTGFNGKSQNEFCLGCELTFQFGGFNILGQNPTDTTEIAFTGGWIEFYIDFSQDYDPEHYASAGSEGGNNELFLRLEAHEVFNADYQFGPFDGMVSLVSSLESYGEGSDEGSGSSLMDVVGGSAMGHFDTDGEADEADFVFSSSFQPIPSGDNGEGYELFGTADLSGNSVPEPTSIALLGLGLLGFAASRKRKA